MLFKVKTVGGVKTLVPLSGQICTDSVSVNSMQPITANAVAEMFKGTEPQTLYDSTDGKVVMQRLGNLAVFNVTGRSTSDVDVTVPKVIMAGSWCAPLLNARVVVGETYFSSATRLRMRLSTGYAYGNGQILAFLK